ncbi:hypothetical protein [Actinomadura oligospora]|uniref:hypothetical protein n=1 Tax=Actinomadura oligospora TaxID=111804 RepID=UPI00047E58E6|nr:hypothetical protein [Actinomadura oligospora]
MPSRLTVILVAAVGALPIAVAPTSAHAATRPSAHARDIPASVCNQGGGSVHHLHDGYVCLGGKYDGFPVDPYRG